MNGRTRRPSAGVGGQGRPQMDKQLLTAATSGDSTSMKHYACHNPGILLETTPAGNTCLHISCIYGHEGFCKDVLQLEESLLVAVNLDGETPLITAVRNGHISLTSFLLGRCCCQPAFRGAILQQDEYGFTALHHAIRNGHSDLALELVTAEPALARAVSKCNESPLFFAVMRKFAHVCEKLMQNPDCAYSGGLLGLNCLHAAVYSGDQGIAQLIMEKRPGLAREFDDSKPKTTPVTHAALFRKKRPESAREFDESDSSTPVTHAALFGKIDMLRVMLEHDSTLGYEMNSMGYTLLIAATIRGQVAAAQEILKHCPDAPYKTKYGKTVLHEAVLNGHLEFVEFVLKTPILRKLVNMQDDEGHTALHYAVKICNPRMVAALLSHGYADVTLLSNRGVSIPWVLNDVIQNAKTLNWNEVLMLMSRACPQDVPILRMLHVQAKHQATEASRKDARHLIQTYTNNTSLVAILMTTITFAAAFTLPGGYSSDPGSEGLPIMSRKVALQAFLISDTIAMCSSFVVTFICIIARWEDYEFLIYYRSFTQKLMWFACTATTTAFSTGLYTVLAPRPHWLAIAICVLVALVPIFTWLLGQWPVLKLRFRLGRSFRSDLLSMV